MILADKIMEERKRNGWSQEQLAEKLDVSRQSISKWESAQSVPDLNRIIQMADIFGVSTDYLLKDDYKEKATISDSAKTFSEKPLRKVSLEEAQELLSISKVAAHQTALGAALCIIACVPLVVLLGFAESHKYGLTENVAGSVGVISLFALIGIGTFFLIKSSFKLKKFDYLEKEWIETEYGVEGLAKKNKEQYEATYHRNITLGVLLCIASFVPLVAVTFFTEEDYILVSLVGLMLLLLALAAYIFISSQMRMASHDKLLQEGDYTKSKKKASPILENISGIFWLTVVAIYLAWSLMSQDWENTWIVWPVAGVLYATVLIITRMIVKVED